MEPNHGHHEHEDDLPTSFEDVRIAIFRQHKQLQQLTDELESLAEAIVGGAIGDRALRASRMRDAIRILHARFLRHLAFEETRLVPLLRRSPNAEGAAETLLREHEEQRAQVNGLLHDAAVYSDPGTYARASIVFINALRQDMAAEELWLRGTDLAGHLHPSETS